MKKCNKCLTDKPLDQFFKDKNNVTDGHYSICKSCKQTATLAHRAKNKDKYNAQMRAYRKVNYHAERLYRYGLTVAKHNQMLADQNNLCAICSQPLAKDKPLVIDHCHTTNTVRGLLCYKCNRDMVAVDDKEHLAKLISYRDKKHE